MLFAAAPTLLAGRGPAAPRPRPRASPCGAPCVAVTGRVESSPRSLLHRRALVAGGRAAGRAPVPSAGRLTVCQSASEPVQEEPMNLVLIGGRGCGKSSICRRIQATDKRLKLFSLDDVIVYEAEGRSIPQIVEEEGWPAFRDIEYETCRKAGNIPGWALVDCGGGVVVDLDEEGNEVYSDRKVEALKKHGVVVYIHRDVDYLIGRIEGDTNRPDLSATNSFREIMARREPWYAQAADLVVDCSSKKKKKVVIARQILDWYYEQCGTVAQPGKWYNLFKSER